MKIWVFIESGDDGFYTTTHLTEKGCLLRAVECLVEVLGVNCDTQEHYEAWIQSLTHRDYHNIIDGINPVGWREKTLKELWMLYERFSELTWDIHQFDCQVQSTTVEP